MKVLVTGCSGFIGSHLVDRLFARGDEVRCMFHSARHSTLIAELRQRGADIIIGDLAEIGSWGGILDGVQRIYHVAGATRARTRDEYYASNFEGTMNLARACVDEEVDLDRFLFVSSLSAVGPSFNGKPVDESDPYHPVSDYGRSKMLAEQGLLELADQLPVTIVRPSAVYGPRERDLYSYFQLMRYRLFPLIGFNGQRLNLVYCHDVIDGIIQAASSPSTLGKAYFLGGERDYRATEIGELIGSVMGIQPFTLRIPHSFAYSIAALSEGVGRAFRRPVFFNIQKAHEAVQSAWVCSIRNAQNDFDYCPKVDLNEGLRLAYDWYKKEGWL